MKVQARTPLKVCINWRILLKTIFFFVISVILWLILIAASVNVLCYYIKSIFTNGWSSPETVKYAIYLVIGAYFCLILDKNKIYEALNIKRGLPFITMEQVKEKNR